MKKQRFLLMTILCLSIFLGGCAKEAPAEDPLYEEQILHTNELIEQANKLNSTVGKLDIYYEILKLDPRNIDARFGAARCHVDQKQYDLAKNGLLFIAKLEPHNEEVCELLAKISAETGDLSYAEKAIELAKQNKIEEFLSKIPQSPVFSLPEGEYAEKVTLEMSAEDADATIYWSVDVYGINDQQYTAPIRLFYGTTVVSAYAVKDGIPSEIVTMEYTVNYEPSVVKFEEPAVEKMVRLSLKKDSGPITDVECETVTKLNWFDLRDTVSKEADYKKMKLKSLSDLQYFPRLTELVLEYQNKITDYSPLSYCPLLTTLQMENCHLTSTEFVEYVPQIQHLKLYNYTTKWDVYMDPRPMYQLRNLITIDVRGNNLGEQTSKTSWKVYQIDNVIKNNPDLSYININSNQLSNWNLLLNLREVRHINTWGIQQANYSVISKLTSLESLYIYFAYYEWNMSARSLYYLRDLDELKKFGMQGLDDASQLKYLKELEQIEHIVLANSNVMKDEQAIKELREALPGCKIAVSW